MKMIIEAQGVKRQIDGPYALCASREDFQRLYTEIGDWLDEPGSGCGISYGWLYVVDRTPPVRGEPRKWVD